MEFKRNFKAVLVKGIICLVIIIGLSVALYIQENGWEWRNTLIWSVGIPFYFYIFLTVLKTKVYVGDSRLVYRRLFRSKAMRYKDITSVELITTASTGDNNRRSTYFVFHDKYGKKLTINRIIMLSHEKSYRFLAHIKSKNSNIDFDYGCQAIIGDRNPSLDLKEAAGLVLDEYHKRKRGK
ncbi:hypothetical protein ACTNEO_03095 [Gracilibacillus sp. HCP3S3_G5_1]|uniref:hypothetical protein n=1 Tax=unclassified Gracilibacillus TaxID=2625209 RepID=UPI003F8B6D92